MRKYRRMTARQVSDKIVGEIPEIREEKPGVREE
jgi:hypothetical protein